MARLITETSADGEAWQESDSLVFRAQGIEKLRVTIAGELEKRLAYTGAAIITGAQLPCFVNLLYTLEVLDSDGVTVHSFFTGLKPGEIERLTPADLTFTPDADTVDTLLRKNKYLRVSLSAAHGMLLNAVYPGTELPALPETPEKRIAAVFEIGGTMTAAVLAADYFDRNSGRNVSGFEMLENIVSAPGNRYALVKGRTRFKAIFTGLPDHAAFGSAVRELEAVSSECGGICTGTPTVTETEYGYYFETPECICTGDSGRITLSVTDNFGNVHSAAADEITVQTNEPAVISGFSWQRCRQNGTVSSLPAENTSVKIFTGPNDVVRLFSLSECSLRIEYLRRCSAEEPTAIAVLDRDETESFFENGIITDSLLRSRDYIIRMVVRDEISGEEITAERNIPMADIPENSDAVIFDSSGEKNIEFPWQVVMSGGFSGNEITEPTVLSQLEKPGIYWFPPLENGGHRLDAGDPNLRNGAMGMLIFGTGANRLRVLFDRDEVTIF